ncbi:Aldehyde/histidinol dehydrogenase [Mucor mucedo]|uniref:Aldehyde/histidinol dehydrogenase n=1 Tax=Mucor mucedo TaxID=29922 RepID=UPI00221FE388|nr:Aldehyde/histidinol dehydrogenase [Mucor mucedo]KAI7893262.1 Aldehyde/histidinol dehydrogenase [Mucor mucedo]
MNALDKCTVRKEPKGVVLVIGSWNYPVHLLLLPVVGAIAAGNCVAIKPSEVACHTAAIIGELIPQYLDPKTVSVVQGGVQETTTLLAEEFNHIFYTGNGAVGKIVMAAASKHLTPVTLELGGKSPAFIAPDANIEVAASRIMWGKYYNAGQTCVAPDYVLILKSQANQFIEACKKVLIERYGQNPQASDSYCRIISERRFDAVKSFIDNVDDSRIIVGGQTDKKDLYVAPTIVYPVASDETGLMQEEIFGPILPIVPVEDMDEAIRIVNSKNTPLTIYIFTEILDKTQSGGVLVNDVLMHVQELGMPFGGVGASGMGSYHGPKSFETFSHERATMIKSSGLESLMVARYPPYNDSKLTLFTMLTIGLPETVTGKVKSVFQAIGAAHTVFFSSNNDGSDQPIKL